MGANQNASQFYITLCDNLHSFDGKHTVSTHIFFVFCFVYNTVFIPFSIFSGVWRGG